MEAGKNYLMPCEPGCNPGRQLPVDGLFRRTITAIQDENFFHGVHRQTLHVRKIRIS